MRTLLALPLAVGCALGVVSMEEGELLPSLDLRPQVVEAPPPDVESPPVDRKALLRLLEASETRNRLQAVLDLLQSDAPGCWHAALLALDAPDFPKVPSERAPIWRDAFRRVALAGPADLTARALPRYLMSEGDGARRDATCVRLLFEARGARPRVAIRVVGDTPALFVQRRGWFERLLTADATRVQVEAAVCLLTDDPYHRAARACCLRALKDPDVTTVRRAIDGLERSRRGTLELAVTLLRLRDSADRTVVTRALEAIGVLAAWDAEANRVAEAILPALDVHERARLEAARTLASRPSGDHR